MSYDACLSPPRTEGPVNMLRKVLIPLVNPVRALPYLKLGAALLPPDGKIVALKIVEIPEQQSLSVGAEKTPIYRAALEPLESQLPDGRVELKTLVRVSREISAGVLEAVREEAIDLLVLPWKGYSTSEERFYSRTIDRLLERLPCNSLVVRAGGFSDCKRILLPVRGGPYAEFALEIASRLAINSEAEVTVLHCEQRSRSPGLGSRAYRSFLDKLRFHPHVNRLITLHGDPRAAILQEAKAHDMLIAGAGFRPEPQEHFLGTIVEQLSLKTDKPLIVVKTADASLSDFGEIASGEKPRPLSEKVDKWFAENTFHVTEFDDLARLVELKEKQGVTISLGLPALNEAETIGEVIRTVKKKLFDDLPLLDEIVLIDSGSTDDTVRIAENLGVPVHIHQQILPAHGFYSGKGEALWKSLFVLKGDIVVWIDTDIKNIHPGFVYGVLGPLLREKDLQYVKGFYRRPLKVEGETLTEGGGRVTELTARPFLNLFFAELSGIIQPLAGEYAGRREALECVPFFTGYGVETGLLIDIFNKFGLRAIAQVDLGARVHRNQSLPALSQMSFAIMQVFMQRLEEKNAIKLLEDVNRSMKLVKHRGETYSLDIKTIGDGERPPINTLPEYRANRQQLLSINRAVIH